MGKRTWTFEEWYAEWMQKDPLGKGIIHMRDMRDAWNAGQENM